LMSRPRRRDKDAKIAAILRTSNTLFKSQGYTSTSTNQIAAEAGVSIGLLYKYFPGGKPDIAKRLIEGIRDEIMLNSLDAVTPLNAQVYLRDALLRFIKGHRQISSNIAAFEIASLEDEKTRRFAGDLYTIGSDSVMDVLKLVGLEDDEKQEQWGIIIFHVIDSVIHRHVLYDGLIASDEELADFLTRMLTGVFSAIRGKQGSDDVECALKKC